MMEVEFDPQKDRINREKHRLSLALARFLFNGPHVIFNDDKEDYGEDRFQALGKSAGHRCLCVFT